MLTRIRFEVEPSTKEKNISYNSNRTLQKHLYSAMSLNDTKLGQFVHDIGYNIKGSNKHFKLWGSSIFYKNCIMKKECIEVDKLEIVITGKKEIVDSIVKGVVKMGYIMIDNVPFKINNLLKDKKVYFSELMLYRTASPVVVSKTINGKKYFLNMIKDSEMYWQIIKNNLLQKYELIYGESYDGILDLMIENEDNIKKKSIETYKNNYDIGYNYNLWIYADEKMQRIAYYLGVGEQNAVGLGHLAYITSKKPIMEVIAI